MPELSNDAIEVWARSSELGATHLPDVALTDVQSSDIVVAALGRFGALLDQGAGADPAAFAARLRQPATLSELRDMLAQTGERRTLRVIGWLLEALPDGTAVAADLLEGSDAQGITSAMAEATRAGLLGRLYAPDRLTALEEACRGALALREAA